ncbi:MAG: arylsulfatase [Planctomyces sp.]
MNQRFLFLPFFVMSLCSSQNSEAGLSEKPPNVLIILADDLGYSDTGCYGGEIQTPALDGLAQNGIRFTQCYNTARCWPSRAVLMTGYYAQQVRRDAHFSHQRRSGQGTRPAWAPLLPRVLKQKQYRSYHSGKWHLDGTPLQNGFDHALTIEDHNRFFNPREMTRDDQPVRSESYGGDTTKKPEDSGAADTNRYATIQIAEHAIECLKQHADRYSDQPFFQYVAFTSPHFPLHALPDDIELYRKRFTEGWDVLRKQRGHRQREFGLVSIEPSPMERLLGPPYHVPKDLDRLGSGEVFNAPEWIHLTDQQREFQATKMAIHAAMVDRMDREIGRILEQIRSAGMLDDTLIMFASDNGASAEIMVRGDGHQPDAPAGSAETYLCLGPGFSSLANTPFRRHKTWVHEGGISTPLIVHWPNRIKARNQLRHVPVHLMDVFPTVLAAAGLEVPQSWDGTTGPERAGKNLISVFEDDQPQLHPELWWCHDNHRAIRTGDWKLVAISGQPWELYDLAKDRGETVNLADQQRDRVVAMEAQWNRLAEQFRRDSE